MESPRFHVSNTYGPVPTGLVASASTPFGSIMAPIRVVIRKSQSLLGVVSVTCSWFGLTALASATTFMAALSEMVQLPLLTLLIDHAAVSAVNWLPLLNFALVVRSKVYVFLSSETFHEVARLGTILPSWSCLTRVS